MDEFEKIESLVVLKTKAWAESYCWIEGQAWEDSNENKVMEGSFDFVTDKFKETTDGKKLFMNFELNFFDRSVCRKRLFPLKQIQKSNWIKRNLPWDSLCEKSSSDIKWFMEGRFFSCLLLSQQDSFSVIICENFFKDVNALWFKCNQIIVIIFCSLPVAIQRVNNFR